VYNTYALTEDFELTLCIKKLGYKTVSPKECTVITETMPDLKQLWNQRLRWQRGALDCIKIHKLNKVTLPYLGKQVETGIGILSIFLIWILSFWYIFVLDSPISLFWLSIGLIFYVERVISAWRGGVNCRILSLSFFPDFLFDMFLSLVYTRAMIDFLTRSDLKWGIATIDKE